MNPGSQEDITQHYQMKLSPSKKTVKLTQAGRDYSKEKQRKEKSKGSFFKSREDKPQKKVLRTPRVERR